MTEKKDFRKIASTSLDKLIAEKVDLKKGPAKWRDGLGGATASRTSAHRSDYREFQAQEKFLLEEGLSKELIDKLREPAPIKK